MHNQPPLLSIIIHVVRVHESLAGGCSVTGTCSVHVLGVETFGAVVAVAAVFQWFYSKPAVLTGECFLSGNKGHISSGEADEDMSSLSVEHLVLSCVRHSSVLL